MLEVDNQYKAIIKKAEERSRDLLDEADRDIKNYKNKFEKLEKDKEKIAKKVIENLIY
jgi:vacuolar-type H+-ATPase subunit H